MAQPYIIAGSSPANVERERQRFLAEGGDPSRVQTVIKPIVQPDGTITRPVSDTAPFPQSQFVLPDTSRINSGNIAQTLTIPYVSPAYTQAPSLASISPDVGVTPTVTPVTGEAGKAQDLLNRIQKIYEETAGKAGYKVQQEQQQGIGEKERVVSDLTAQLLSIKNEGTAIPLQLESQAAGRGITTALLGRQQQELLRNNAIKALTVSAQLEAARGNLQLALNTVDRLVEAKYAPLEAERDAKLANLNLIIKSPAFSAEEKAQAEAQKVKEEAKKDQDAVSKSITTQISNILLDPEFQANAPAIVKKQVSDLAQKVSLTQADLVSAANIGARYKVAPKIGISSTSTDITDIKEREVKMTEQTLTKSKGEDGFADPGIFQTERARSRISPDEFNKRFGYLLSPQEQKQIGIVKQTSSSAQNDNLGFEDL